MFDIDASDIGERTRRAVLRTAAGALGFATVVRASAHEWGSASTADDVGGGSPTPQDAPGGMRRTEVAGYHSLGDVAVEVSADGGPTWKAVSGTRTADAAGDVGALSAFTTGTAVGTPGMAHHQRERLRERLSDALGRLE